MPLKSLTNNRPLPDEPLPEAYKELQSVKMEEKQTDFKMPEQAKELPKSDIYKRMKKLSSFKKIKRVYKLEHQKEQFLSDLKQLFQHLNVEEHQYDIELLLELLNAVEQYFIYGSKSERNMSKEEVIEQVMLPFFGNNTDVLKTFIQTISSKVKKSNAFRRVLRRIYNFFF